MKKDIVLTVRRQRTEVILFLACFVFAFLLNIYSIITYGTEWKELYTQLIWVLALSVLFYGILLILRLLYWGLKTVISKKREYKA